MKNNSLLRLLKEPCPTEDHLLCMLCIAGQWPNCTNLIMERVIDDFH